MQSVSYPKKMSQLDNLPNLKCSWEQTLQSPGKVPDLRTVIGEGGGGGQGTRRAKKEEGKKICIRVVSNQLLSTLN